MVTQLSIRIGIVLVLGWGAALGADLPLNVFYLLETDAGVTLAAATVSPGETVVLGGGDGFITAILPVGPGKSGDLLQAAHRANRIAVTLADGVVTASVVRPDGSRRGLPLVGVAELRTWDVRVNATGGNGVKRAFMIRGYTTWRVDDGPVLDMFAGRIPLADGDWSIMTETAPAEDKPSLAGSAPLRYVDGFLVIDAILGDGSLVPFVVDLGADGTVVFADYLPAGTEVVAVTAVEHSPTGRRELAGEMQGATGGVDAFRGKAVLDAIAFGDIVSRQVAVSVVATGLVVGGRPAAGILGYDLLSRGGRVSFGHGEGARLVLGPDGAAPAEDPTVVALTFAVDHLFLRGAVAGIETLFLLDTGARMSVVPPGIVRAAGLDPIEGDQKQISGLGDRTIDAKAYGPATVRLGDAELAAASLYAADLPVIHALGLNEDVVLLGNDLLARFDRIEVDFTRRQLRFWR